VSRVLVIAGSDSSGGAGITRDVSTLTELGTGALCAITAITAQTDAQVSMVHPLPASVVEAQIRAALAAGCIGAIKIGMLGNAANIGIVCDILAHSEAPLVVDPVLAASSGALLLDGGGRKTLRSRLVPLATLVTPNIPEAAALLGVPRARSHSELVAQGEALLALGARAVLLKGGHGEGSESVDLLFTNTTPLRELRAARSANTRRGSGCALAAAIAAGLAAGLGLHEACRRAKDYIGGFFQRGDSP
jgi:hydroxymethylpyrimidine/phosphomethylpyrimidine kinase